MAWCQLGYQCRACTDKHAQAKGVTSQRMDLVSQPEFWLLTWDTDS